MKVHVGYLNTINDMQNQELAEAVETLFWRNATLQLILMFCDMGNRKDAKALEQIGGIARHANNGRQRRNIQWPLP